MGGRSSGRLEMAILTTYRLLFVHLQNKSKFQFKMTIQEFSFGNFKSFKDIQTLNLSAAKIKSKNKDIDQNNVIEGNNKEGVSFLKSKAIYGANASGKSNIIMAIYSFIRIIKTSVKDEKVLTFTEPFGLSTETENEPTFFQIIFWHENTKYRYGFEADKENITAEWLYGKPKDRELPFFIRDNQNIIKFDKTNYKDIDRLLTLSGDATKVNEIFRNNSLLLSTLATFGFGELSRQLIDSFDSISIIPGLGNREMFTNAKDSLKDANKRKYMIDLLRYGDIGIEDLDMLLYSSADFPDDTDREFLKDIGNKKQETPISIRKKFNENLVTEDKYISIFMHGESEGTLKLFELSPHIYHALKNKTPIIIDEFDARFHPLLTKKIVQLFNSKENKGAQLIFVTHDTNLLSADLLRRDQIEFVEKDKYGASHLYSLVQFKGIRNNASFEKDYIQGKYGAIPFLGDFSKLIDTEEDA